MPDGEAGPPRDPLIDQVAAATVRYPFRRWGFGESIALEAVLAAGGAPGTIAADLVDTWAITAPPLSQDPLAHVAPGVPLLRRYQATHDPRLLARARELAALLTGTTAGAAGARIHRPDLAGWEHEVWVDCMHLDGPFLAELALATGEAQGFDQAATLLLTHARVLQDERSGLFSHGFDDATGRRNQIHWGRGQGWALLGLVDTLHALPVAHAARLEIEQRLQAQIAGLVATEHGAGTWPTVVDHPGTAHEPSVSAFVAVGLRRAHSLTGSTAAIDAVIARAAAAVRHQISPAGDLMDVSDATPVGTTIAHYDSRARGIFPWGQGPALLTLLETESQHDNGISPLNSGVRR